MSRVANPNPFDRVTNFLKAGILAIVAVAVIGAALRVDVTWLVNGIAWLIEILLPGMVTGAIVAATVAAITKDMPRALLFGGATAVVLTVVLRVWFWLETHFG